MTALFSAANGRAAACLASLVVLSSCGGGGSSDAAPAVSLAFIPADLTHSHFTQETHRLEVTVYVTNPPTEDVFVRIVDEHGVFDASTVSVIESSDGTYRAGLSISPLLAAGNHQGSLAVHLCRDLSCTSEYAGSPAYLPYGIEVLSRSGNLKPLVALEGAAPWSTEQGNAAHDGHVPVTLDVNNFSLRWYWQNPALRLAPTGAFATSLPLAPATAAGGRIVATTPDEIDDLSPRVFQVSEDSGTLKWTHEFPAGLDTSAPALSDGLAWVYAGTWPEGGGITFSLYAFDADGNLDATISGPADGFPSSGTVLVDNGTAFVPNQLLGSLHAINAADGTEAWSADGPNTGGGTGDVQMALRDGVVYAYFSLCTSTCNIAGLYVLDRTDGTEAFSIAAPTDDSTSSAVGTPALGSEDSVFVRTRESRLVRFDLGARTVDWIHDAFLLGTPAVADGTVFMTEIKDNSLALLALDEFTGETLWSWEFPSYELPFNGNNTVVTNNLVFVSSTKAVYAIDRTTQQQVWRFPIAGNLAITENGTLLITRIEDKGFWPESVGGIVAINLH